MIKAYYTSATGSIYLQKGLDVIANNIANVNTVGYKAQRASFADLLYQNMRKPQKEDEFENLQVGNGVKLQKVDLTFGTSGFIPTGVNTDFAINGEGFFAVEDNSGNRYFTRNGAFNRKIEEDGQVFLTDKNGNYVLNANEERINITELEKASSNGTVNYNLGVFSFPNQYELKLHGNSLYEQTDWSGEPELTDTKAVQSFLEASSVDTADQMAQIIETQRAFQFNTRIIQVSDEIQQTVNSLW